MAFILNSLSTLRCMHGGSVQHVPTVASMYKVDGSPPMRVADTFLVVGCPYVAPIGPTMLPSPCTRIQWFAPSMFLIVLGSPALTNTSTGMCFAASGVAQGQVVIASFQMFEKEPNTFTRIDY